MSEKHIGAYKIIALLGQGGMAQVFRAEHEVMEREVALKELLPAFLSEPQAEARFLREAKLLAKLEHTAIVPIYDSGKDENAQRLYLVMRLMKGGSLEDLLKTKGKLSVLEYLPILQRIVQALSFAHKNNVVHRDLKPGNVMFDGEGLAYLSDFGIAHVAQQTVQMTATGAKLGTPQYMAPEQFDSGVIDGRTDQYALAVMSYQALTGKRPFDADTLMRLMKMHLMDVPPTLTLPDARLGERLNAVLQKALAKSPEGRYPSCQAFLQAFEQAIRDSQPKTLPTALDSTLLESRPADEATLLETPAAWYSPTYQAPPTRPPEPVAPPRASGMPLWLLGCAGAIAFALLGVLALLILSRKQLATTPDYPIYATHVNAPATQMPPTHPPATATKFLQTVAPSNPPPPTAENIISQQPTATDNSSNFECPGMLPTRLKVGLTVQVPSGQDANAVWRAPNTRNEKVGLVAPNIPFEIIDGPVCDKYIWWKIHLPNGIKGWTAESDSRLYWLEIVR